ADLREVPLRPDLLLDLRDGLEVRGGVAHRPHYFSLEAVLPIWDVNGSRNQSTARAARPRLDRPGADGARARVRRSLRGRGHAQQADLPPPLQDRPRRALRPDPGIPG